MSRSKHLGGAGSVWLFPMPIDNMRHFAKTCKNRMKIHLARLSITPKFCFLILVLIGSNFNAFCKQLVRNKVRAEVIGNHYSIFFIYLFSFERLINVFQTAAMCSFLVNSKILRFSSQISTNKAKSD